MLRKRLINCIAKPESDDSVEAIASVRGEDDAGQPFEATREQVYDDIKNGQWAYIVHVGNNEADVEAYLRNGKKFIRTKPDGDPSDNLLKLRRCD
jgi:hypothetical protein